MGIPAPTTIRLIASIVLPILVEEVAKQIKKHYQDASK